MHRVTNDTAWHWVCQGHSVFVVLVLVLVLVLDSSSSSEEKIDYENENEDEDDWGRADRNQTRAQHP